MTIDIEELRAEAVRITRLGYERGLTVGVSGNTSLRIPGMEQILIKRSGVSFGDVTAEDFLLVSLNGEVLEGNGRPSKEINFHLGIYRARPDVGGVFHGHAPHTTAYAVAGKVPPLVTLAGAKGLGEVPLVGFAPAGSQELAGMVTAAFGDPDVKAAVLERHGSVTVGPDLKNAYHLADLLEDTAKVALLTKLVSL